MAEGFVAPGFEGVRAAFEQNFAEGLELGAAFAVYRCDQPLVDLWGGAANQGSGAPWTESTIVGIFSGSKGIVATVMAMLLDRGLIALDAPVARYWPEFGKPDILIRNIVSHTGRLPGIVERVTPSDALDPIGMARRLAAQTASSDPRATLTYHPFTYGWLCGELVRCVTGRDIGRFVADEIAGPLGLDIYLGLPAELEPRVARFELAPEWVSGGGAPVDLRHDPLRWSISNNPEILNARSFIWNDPATHQAVIAGAGVIGASRSIARLYALLANGGTPLLSAEGLQTALTPLVDGFDQLNNRPWRFGVGFELTAELHGYGPPGDAFGHSGAGGSVHGAWPSHHIGFSYSMNLMRDLGRLDARAERLLDALYLTVTP